MKKYIFLQKFSIFISSILVSTFIQANIPIQMMPSSQNINYDKSQLVKLTAEALSHESINMGPQSNYRSVKVQLLLTRKADPYLVAHLMSRYVSSYKMMRINLTKDGAIIYPIQQNYQLTAEDFAAQRGYAKNNQPTCPTEYQTGKPLFVIGTPGYISGDYAGDSSTYHAVNTVSQAVLNNKQYQLVQLLDGNATIANYQNVLSCPNLKYFFHIGGEDDYGKSFFLTDGDFDASFFKNNPQLDLSGKVISFDTCRAFDQVQDGFCQSITLMPKPPLVYTAGSSQLLMWGSTETYACFWEKILEDNSPLTKETLENCAMQYDPSVPGSRAGIYFIGEQLFDGPVNNKRVVIKTNFRTLAVPPIL